MKSIGLIDGLWNFIWKLFDNFEALIVDQPQTFPDILSFFDNFIIDFLFDFRVDFQLILIFKLIQLTFFIFVDIKRLPAAIYSNFQIAIIIDIFALFIISVAVIVYEFIVHIFYEMFLFLSFLLEIKVVELFQLACYFFSEGEGGTGVEVGDVGFVCYFHEEGAVHYYVLFGVQQFSEVFVTDEKIHDLSAEDFMDP